MKKVIDGAEYNTDTATKLCEKKYFNQEDINKGTIKEGNKQLYKTNSGKFFFYVKEEFTTYVDVNNDDLNPKFEEMDVIDERIVPISYDLALQCVEEVLVENPTLNTEVLRKHFPELVKGQSGNEKKYQKKIYLSESANWYLQLMVNEKEETNSSLIERLIKEEYKRLYRQGIMTRDPFNEMEK